MKLNVRQLSLAGVLLASGFIAGVVYQDQDSARADVRKGAPREAFLAGSERSEPHLKEISETLLRIEKQIGNVEQRLNSMTPKAKN
ncbi:MAG: hypothetical protein ACKVT0_03875 [Planctomycetaceae bacterium]